MRRPNILEPNMRSHLDIKLTSYKKAKKIKIETRYIIPSYKKTVHESSTNLSTYADSFTIYKKDIFKHNNLLFSL